MQHALNMQCNFPADCQNILEDQEFSADLQFEAAAPWPLLLFNTKHLQSKRYPQQEAENLVNHWLDENSRHITLIGICSYYLFNELVNQLDKNCTLTLIEKDPKLLKSFLSALNITKTPETQPSIKFICHSDEEELCLNFRKELSANPKMCDALFIAPACERLRWDLKQLRERLRIEVRLEAMDRITVASFADEWLQNSLINLPEISQSCGIQSLYGQFKDRDALIICAGPSLNDSLECIKQLQNRYLIIVVGTALKPCLKAGIKPHLTIVLDSDPKVFKQFMNITDLPGYLIASYNVFPAIFQLYGKRLFPFNSNISNDFARWLEQAGIKHGELHVGGTVSLSAIDSARRLGCRNLMIFGLDLCFSEDGTSHAANTMYEDQKIIQGLVRVKGNKVKTVGTTGQFASYIEIINAYLLQVFSDFKGKTINVNKSGAFIKGLQLMSPEEFSGLKHQPEIDLHQRIEELSQKPDCRIDAHFQQTINTMKQIACEGKALLEQLQGSKIPQGLEEYENKVQNDSFCSQLLSPALKAWCMSIENNETDPLTMTRSFLSQVQGCAEWISGLLELSQQRYKQITEGVSHG